MQLTASQQRGSPHKDFWDRECSSQAGPNVHSQQIYCKAYHNKTVALRDYGILIFCQNVLLPKRKSMG